jgi:glutamine amidotransferase
VQTDSGMTITVVDYGRGNLFSLAQALRLIGEKCEITSDPAKVAVSERIILPGVGAFGDAMEGLRDRGLVDPIIETATKGVPLLGVCVGCQVLMSKGQEFGEHDGLGLIAGTVTKLPSWNPDDATAVRIPNVGWHPVTPRVGASGAARLLDANWMYFVHSYTPRPNARRHIAATIRANGEEVAIAVADRNVIGVQFHPEKSGTAGLAFLRRFLEVKAVGNSQP